MNIAIIKDNIIKYKKIFSSIFAIFFIAIKLSLFFCDIPKYIWPFILIFSSICLSFMIYLFLKKAQENRHNLFKIDGYINIFKNTHNTWHKYKELSDYLHSGFEIDDVLLLLQTNILNLIVNLRNSLETIYKNKTFRICIKGIVYKDIKKLNKADSQNYKNMFFELVDLDIRDPKNTPSDNKDIIKYLDFDPNTNRNYQELTETLFYKAFVKKGISYCSEFNNIQQKLTKKYKSGIVSSINLQGIPFGLLCIGIKEKNETSKNDEELIATFTDCIAEYIRLKLIFTAISKSNKVIVFGDINKKNEYIKRVEELLKEMKLLPEDEKGE